MKRFCNYLTFVVMLMATSVSMTSCDDDDADQAYDMNGIWQGIIQGSYYVDRFHNNDYDTEIQFVQEGVFAHGGYGLETDYPLIATNRSLRWNSTGSCATERSILNMTTAIV